MNATASGWDACDDAELDQRIALMTVEEQVGQLLAVPVPGKELDSETGALLRDCHIGSVVLFGHNVGTPEQLRALTAEVERLCGRPGLPALIAADQEGGRVRRLKAPATSFPSAMALGATGSAQHAYRWGLATARELRACGINVNFAPVLDVNNNPLNPVIGTRSYGERPELVTRLALAAIEGLRDGGAIATAKHFPGHGDTHVDSHDGLPTIAHERKRLEAVELAPFKAAIEAGVPAIMTAHIVFEALDPRLLPATLSRPILSDFLRDELGFRGAIVSDAMVMQAIVERYGLVDGSVSFIAAGGDLVEALRDDRTVYDALLAKVNSGGISRSQLVTSVRRVWRLKQWLAARPAADPAWLGHAQHREWSAAIARDAVTLLRDDSATLPLGTDARVAVLDCFYAWTFQAEMRLPATSAFGAALAARLPHVESVILDGRAPTPDQIAAARAAVDAADVVAIATRGARLFERQAAFVREVLAWGKPVITLALNEPYDLMAYPEVSTALALYGSTSELLGAAVAILIGAETARGRLPVSLPGLYDVGHGL